MMSSHEYYLIIGPEEPTVRRFRFSIRSWMILVAVLAGPLAWSVRYFDIIKNNYKELCFLFSAILVVIVFLVGMVWSIARIYKNPPGGQTLSIVVLIGSLLWPI